MQSTPRSPAYQRCPSCASRIAADATSCPICGHEFPPPEPAPAPVESEDVSAVRSARRPDFSLAQLPWGVIGVVAVIAALAISAVLLLRSSNLLAPPAPSIIVTIDGTQAAALTPQATTTPTATPPQATPTKIAVTPTPILIQPTLTPVPPKEYTVKSGDTCGGIADDQGVPLSAFLALNNLNRDNCLIQIGEVVKIPAPTPTPGPSPTLAPGVTAPPGSTPEPTVTLPPQIVIQVKSGDTCGDIAVRNRVSVGQLIQQNKLDADCNLQIGQVLTVTFATPTPSISPTPIVAQTSTPRVGFDAPQLLGPSEGAQITETEDVVTLQWLSMGLLKDNEWYVVEIHPSGAITVPIFETHATSIKITRAIFGDQLERSFAWWVQVKQYLGSDAATGERSYAPISPPSAVRHFTWRRPAVAVTPTPQ